MIDFRDILAPECTRFGIEARSQKAALEEASGWIGRRHREISARRLTECLLARERLGSTGIGDGVAIPHCRSAMCAAPVAAFMTAQAPLDFDAPDEQPVDLLLVLAVPEGGQEAHLKILGTLARVFHAAANRASLRAAGSSALLYETLLRQTRQVQGMDSG